MDTDMKKDFYTILGIRRTATQKDIKSAFKRASQKWHPDKHLDPEEKKIAAEIFRECKDAFEILSDEKKRKIYDRYGMDGFSLVQKNIKNENEDIYDTLLDREDEIKGIEFPRGGEVTVTYDVPNRGFEGYSINHNFHSILSDHKVLVFGASVTSDRKNMGVYTYAEHYFNFHDNSINAGLFLYNSLLGYRLGIQRNIYDSKYNLQFESFFQEGSMPAIKVDKIDKFEDVEIKSSCNVNYHGVDISSSVKYTTNKDKDEYLKVRVSRDSPISLEYQRERAGFGISFNQSFLPNLTWTTKAKIGPRKNYSMSSVFGVSGVSWVFGYHQHDHSFSIPVVWAHSFSWFNMLYVAAMPVFWALVHSPFLFTNGFYRYSQAQKDRIIKKVNNARIAQEKLMDEYEKSKVHDLVIQEARYGRDVENDNHWDEGYNWYNWIDVTIPIQISVHVDEDGPKISLDNLYLAGVVDTAPKEDKSLYIEYTFRNKKHLAIFKESEPIKLPMLKHCIEENANYD